MPDSISGRRATTAPNISGENERSDVIRYIHRNPFKRDLVANREDSPSSSFRHDASGEPAPVDIESTWTADCGPPTHREMAPMNGAR